MDIFFFNDTATTETYTLSLPAALPILDTNHNQNGSTATCVDPSKPLDIFNYPTPDLPTLPQMVTLHIFTNTAPNFAILINFRAAGPDMGVGYQLQPPGAIDPPGKYKLG